MSKIYSKINHKLLFILILAALIRIFFAIQPAQPYDIATFQAWAQSLHKLGAQQFYQQVWTDYLPLPIYLLSEISSLARLTPLSFSTFFKLTISFLELSLIFLFATSFKKNSKKYILFSLLFSPALIINSSLWGQIDTVVALTLAISLSCFTTKPIRSALFYGISASFKPIILITLPLIIIYFLLKHTKNLISFSLISFTLFFTTGIPPVIQKIHNPIQFFTKPFLFLYHQSINQASTYPFTTVNAFNLWSITGKNWLPDTKKLLGITPHLFGIFLFFVLATSLIKKTQYLQKISLNKLIFLSTSFFLLFFTFTTRMHERHLLYALPLLLLASTQSSISKIAYPVFTFLNSANMLSAFFWVNNQQTWPISLHTRIILSLLTVFYTFYFVFQDFSQTLFRRIKSQKTLFLFLALAFLLRVFTISQPPQMIFDEVYHAFTAKTMLANDPKAWEWWNTPPEGFAYEWTHPPVAKYGMVLGMLVFGSNSFGWRIGSALIGTLSLYFVYQLTKTLLKNKTTALLAVFLLSLEGLHLVQSRVAMNDIYLLAFTLASLTFAAKSQWKKSSIFFGLALSSKWSALYAIPPLLLLFFRKKSLSFKNLFLLLRCLLLSLITYILLYFPFFLSGHTYQNFLELHKQMWIYHTQLDASHSYQSQPWQWLLALRPVWFYVKYLPQKTANIYTLSNPAIAWTGLIALIFSLKKIFSRFSYFFLSFTYFIFFLPWVFSPRIMFAYHYLPSITFLTIILASWLQSRSFKLKLCLTCFIIVAFILLSPAFYGFFVPKTYWNTLFTIFPSWK